MLACWLWLDGIVPFDTWCVCFYSYFPVAILIVLFSRVVVVLALRPGKAAGIGMRSNC